MTSAHHRLMARVFEGHRGAVYALSRDASDDRFLSGSGDGTVVSWDRSGATPGLVLATVDKAIYSVYRSGPILLIGTEQGDLRALDLHHRVEFFRTQAHQRGIFRIVPIGPDLVGCAGGDGDLSVWKMPTSQRGELELMRRIPLCAEKLRDLAVDPTHTMLAVACGDGHVRILDTERFNELATFNAHPGAGEVATGATCAAFHPTKPVLITGGKDGYLRTWHTHGDERAVLSIPAHKGTIYRIAFSPNGRLFATASRDKTAKVWDAETFEVVHRSDRNLGGHTHSVNTVRWDEQGELYTGSDDRTIKAFRPVDHPQ